MLVADGQPDRHNGFFGCDGHIQTREGKGYKLASENGSNVNQLNYVDLKEITRTCARIIRHAKGQSCF